MRYGRGKHKTFAELSASTSHGAAHPTSRSSSLRTTWIGTGFSTRMIVQQGWSRCNLRDCGTGFPTTRIVHLQAWSRRKLRACVTFFQVHHLRLSRSTNYGCALTVRLSTINFVIILRTLTCGSFVLGNKSEAIRTVPAARACLKPIRCIHALPLLRQSPTLC